MKSTLILSDTHIGGIFSQKRMQSLIDLVQDYDRIIFNGDFLDDCWDYVQTIRSSWSEFFEILKEKEVIYLFGNHDRDSGELRSATKSFVDVFADDYVLPVGPYELIIMHGHTIYPRPDGILYSDKKTRIGFLFQKMIRILWHIVYPVILIVRLLIERYPKTLARMQRPFVVPQNKRMKKYAKQHLKNNQILICGHSHLQEDAREQQFINTGANCYERLEYLSIVNDTLELGIKHF